MFDAKAAAKELKAYRKKGPTGATRRLLDAILANTELSADTSLLDIGGGVGVLQHELARAGVGFITAVDASTPYLKLLEGEARDGNYEDRQKLVCGDFVDVSEQVPESSIVTLDKVICCYPHMDRLVASSAKKAQKLYAIVVPRDSLLMRLFSVVANCFMRTVLHWSFRSYVHRMADIDRVCREQGLYPRFTHTGFIWRVRLYTREAW
jgi:2-polyprenyl-3-methyl-5-hydroxy-6-metoxy-1,4-benzoquinol methylase